MAGRSKKGQFGKGHIPWCKGTKGVKAPTFTGCHHTKEAREKISMSKKGKPSWNAGTKGMGLTPGFRGKHTEASKILMSQKHKGKVPWNKGTKASLETIIKLRESHLGKPSWNKGLVMSDEIRDNIRRSKMGKNNPNFGKPRSDETKRKIGNSNKGKERTYEFKQLVSILHKGRPSPRKGTHCSKETKEKLSLANKGRIHTKEAIQKIRMAWKNPEYVAKQMISRGVKPNKLEKHFEKFLNSIQPNEWKYVGDGQLIIGGKCPDFVNINGKKQLIELYGDYWHKGQDPENRKKIFKEFGWNTLVIWERDIRKNPYLKNIINNFICERKLHRREVTRR